MKNKILFAATVLFGLMMINSGLNKFFNYMPMPELSPEMLSVVMAFVTIKWIFPLVAITEIVGGILMAIPRYRALGALVIFPVMVGIVVHHMTHDIEGIGVGLVMFVINMWVIIDNKDKYLALINKPPQQQKSGHIKHARHGSQPFPR